MRVEVYKEFLELVKASKPKKGELVYSNQKSKKDGNLILITSAALEASEENQEIKAGIYEFALSFNSWFDDDEKLHRSKELLALLKKKGLPVDPAEMAKRRKIRNVKNMQELKELKEFKKTKKA